MLKIITAIHGQALRDYAATKATNKRVAIFPEAGLSPLEQSVFIKNEESNYDEVITFSPYIISSVQQSMVHVIDSKQKHLNS